jgi:hypothetical protein
VHRVNVVASGDSRQRQLAPQHPEPRPAQRRGTRFDDGTGRQPSIVLGVSGLAGDNELMTKAAHDGVDVLD